MNHWPFRVSMTVAAVLLFDQAIFAGRMLSGSFPALHTHRENATFAGIAVLVAAVCAIPLRRPGRGPLWPAFAGLGLFALIALQIVLGFTRVLIVHVPLGVSIILLAVLLTIWAWRYRPPAESRAPEGPPGEGRMPDSPTAQGSAPEAPGSVPEAQGSVPEGPTAQGSAPEGPTGRGRTPDSPAAEHPVVAR